MKLYKYHPINDYLIEGLRTKTNWYSKLAHLNDPYECFVNDESETNHFQDMLSKLCVCCFSKNMDNYLMWSHYADGHRGVCLEWEVDQDVEGLKDVSYSNDDIILTSIIKKSNDTYITSTSSVKKMGRYTIFGGSKDAMSRKFNMWKSEEEVRRYISYHDNIRGSSEPFIGRLTAIYFGVKAGNDNIDRVKLNVSQIEGVEFKQVGLDTESKTMSIIKDI